MKNIFLYLLLGLLGLSMIVTVDLLAGISFSIQVRTFQNIFATTTVQESVAMPIFLSLPLINPIVMYLKKRNRKPSK
ncbi:hypothetical protein [Paenibacillus wynnii]|uniref:hypothetical protein n=1 Tax=Paenibacillus wynnii TaxID=268407 RepID=UPI00279003E2|nr:hypothetical protein [Paenibacillus wynnii]MDQ0194483.1 ABC-type polysaccharide transport system permease subunit [Paenibacillus wynnii]